MNALLLLFLTAQPTYDEARLQLSERRVELAKQVKKTPAKTRMDARRAVLDYLENAAFPAWAGTPWDFSGTSTVPKQGKIACGYFVSTVFLHAGFQVERIRLAQQASAYIVSTLARGSRVERFTPKDNADALAQIRKSFGDGLLVIGFDYHVGLLRLDGERAEFCHSSFIEPGGVTCEDPVATGAFSSSLYVVADALSDSLLDDWLLGKPVTTLRPPK